MLFWPFLVTTRQLHGCLNIQHNHITKVCSMLIIIAFMVLMSAQHFTLIWLTYISVMLATNSMRSFHLQPQNSLGEASGLTEHINLSPKDQIEWRIQLSNHGFSEVYLFLSFLSALLSLHRLSSITTPTYQCSHLSFCAQRKPWSVSDVHWLYSMHLIFSTKPAMISKVRWSRMCRFKDK